MLSDKAAPAESRDIGLYFTIISGESKIMRHSRTFTEHTDKKTLLNNDLLDLEAGQ